ncbi:putative SNARE domain-containing protein [Neospora caninum Liverpool]|uniref:Putative SNARE domain-containing protein n=1 Tax=Neospora caninum (strain Liverpool) TaxID=572307 RepID=F0VPG8_NEOCL|nr:putative SNARE domain-containing protein [Neospora caninum Liverpool]CBZ55614.1 putative SNARE domain-containing protein [Neospora caninum Liverpool]CEL70356.1 TPA: SNARE domain-containing protein, putative [Neospora caninum Liverpool]|eukprot:XP_003885642.1 putative SNARE domain-containing protein [Neospora caninum Liverpool]
MSDFWKRDVRQVEALRDEIVSLLQQRQKQTGGANTGASGRSSAVLRGKFSQFCQDVEQLERTLKATEAERRGDLSPAEWRQRRDQVAHLHAAKSELQIAFTRAFSTGEDFYDSAASAEVLVDVPRGARVLKTREEDILAEQDEQLSFLEGTVSNLKSIGHAVGDEVDVHRKLLSDLDDDVDRAQTLLEKNRETLRKIIERQSTVCLLLTALALLVVLIFLMVATA